MQKIYDIHHVSEEHSRDINMSSTKEYWELEILKNKKAEKKWKTSKEVFCDDRKTIIDIPIEKEVIVTRALWDKQVDSLRKWKYSFFSKLYVSFSSICISCSKIFSRSTIQKTSYIFGFLFFALAYTFISLSIVEFKVNSAYKQLIDLQIEENIESAQKNLENSYYDFLLAQILFYPYSFLPGEKVDTTHYAISGGKQLSSALYEATNLGLLLQEDLQDTQTYLTDVLISHYPSIISIYQNLQKAEDMYHQIDWIPNSISQGTFLKAQDFISTTRAKLGIIQDNYAHIIELLWHYERKRYLLVFQNADEIRPLWGFMWSMWFIELFRWEKQLFQMKDIYAIEWDLKSADYTRVEAPKGLNELTDIFWLRDANYFIDIDESSKAIDFFIEQAGIDIDGIVYLNHHILWTILSYTWAISLEGVPFLIDADNYSEALSLFVESKASRQATLDTPKQIVFDLANALEKKLYSEGNIAWLLLQSYDVLDSWDVFMWMKDLKQQAIITSMGYAGKKDYEKSIDYIFPVFTSLSGNKSDRYMQRSFSHEVEKIWKSCDFFIRSTIKQQHNMPEYSRQRIEGYMTTLWIQWSPELMRIQWADKNRQYIRAILPITSEIQSQNWMEIVNYGTRKGAELFVDTPEQGTSLSSIEYILKNPSCKDYDFHFFKQAGIQKYDLNLSIFGNKYSYRDLSRDFYFSQESIDTWK